MTVYKQLFSDLLQSEKRVKKGKMNRYTIKAMLLATYVQAGIIQSKFWKRHDIQADSMGMKVVDGITYGTSEEMN